MAIDIGAAIGLPTLLHADGRLSFGPGVNVVDAPQRSVRALARVALDRAACEAMPAERTAYYMYNGVLAESDSGRLAAPDLRFDLTSIPPLRIGRECAKTLGHQHTPRRGQSGTDAEVCEVVHGVAHFLLEFRGKAPGEPTIAYCVEAHPGDKVLFPPDTDHLTINPGPDVCVFTDVVVHGVSNNYEGFQATGGAAYHEVCEDGTSHFQANPAYRHVPPLLRLRPRQYPALCLTAGVPLYRAFVEHGDLWGFLKHPEDFWAAFPDLRGEIGV